MMNLPGWGRSRVLLPGHDTESGFTLVEVLVATAILVIVIGAVYGAFNAGNQSSVMLEEDTDVNQTARVLVTRISRELASVYQKSGTTTSCLVGQHSDTVSSSGLFDNIRFTTVAHDPVSTAGLKAGVCEVTYSEECTADGKPLGLYIREDYATGLHRSDEDVEKLPITLVSDLVVGMTCTYLNPTTEEWVDTWVDQSTLPAAVRVELILKSQRKSAKPITVACTTNMPWWTQ